MLLVNLSQELAILEVSGTDSVTYLQGQLTNDIKLLDKQSFMFAAHLNNKGRMLANFIITKVAENTYHLISNKSIISKVLPRLKMYVLRSNVVMRELEQTNIIFSDHALTNSIYSLELISGNFLSLIETTPDTKTKDLKHWHRFLIKNGICMIYPQTYEQLIPAQVNYDKIGGVSFTKGCYTGQEIVARMHYLGKAKHLMYKFICDTPVQIGQSVISPKVDNQEVGMIVDVVSRDYDCMGLVSIKNDYIEDAFIDDNGTTHQLLIQELIY
jgi:folate-binding protein YgfZ